MKLEYALSKEDFLDFHLYIGSKSKNFDRSILFNRWILGPILVILGLWNYYGGGTSYGAFFVGVGILLLLFYSRYLKWRYERHYQSHIRQHYVDRLDVQATVQITEEYLHMADDSSESKVLMQDMKALIELPQRFLLQLPGGQYLNIPKRVLSDVETTKSFFLQRGIPYQNALDWKWL